LGQGLLLEEAEQRLAIPKGTLGNWVSAAKRSPTTVSAPGSRSVAKLEAENARLRRELVEARMECDVIKKRRRVCYESCLIDEGRPLDVVFQEKASNHFKLLRSWRHKTSMPTVTTLPICVANCLCTAIRK
jgi:hypothetical protein